VRDKSAAPTRGVGEKAPRATLDGVDECEVELYQQEKNGGVGIVVKVKLARTDGRDRERKENKIGLFVGSDTLESTGWVSAVRQGTRTDRREHE
jgi:hypothetical protein